MYPTLVPIDEGSVIDLGGGVTVDVFNLGGHSQNSVVFSCGYYKALFTGDLEVPGQKHALEYLKWCRGI